MNALFLLTLLFNPHVAFSEQTETSAINLTPAMVLDFEILGDTSSAYSKSNDQARISQFSAHFRQQLKQQQIFDLIDDEYSLAQIEKASKRLYLHRCNGCELELARDLGAMVVIAPWVFRVSTLLQVMYFEIRDVATGSVHLRRAYDFRGNSNKAWERAIRYALRDLKAAAKLAQSTASTGE